MLSVFIVFHHANKEGKNKGQLFVTDFFQSPLPHVLALPLHHVKPRQDNQIRLKLIQTCHECFQRAHLPVGHVVGKDEAVGLRCPSWTPLFTWRWVSTEEPLTVRRDFVKAVTSSYLYLLCTQGWGGIHPSPGEIRGERLSAHPATRVV